jgi:hypothetical protein
VGVTELVDHPRIAGGVGAVDAIGRTGLQAGDQPPGPLAESPHAGVGLDAAHTGPSMRSLLAFVTEPPT